MTRPLELVRAIDARGAARKARDAAKRRASNLRRRREEGRRYRHKQVGKRVQRGLLAFHRTLKSLPPDLAQAFRDATPEVRRLIIEQARDDATIVVKGGPRLDDVLEWKALA